MRSALASLVSTAVATHLWEPVEVRPAGAGETWRTVQGRVKRGSTVQQFNGLVTQAVTAADEVHLLAADFAADALPTTDWWVRAADGRVLRLSEPARVMDAAGQFIGAPLRLNTESPVPG